MKTKFESVLKINKTNNIFNIATEKNNYQSLSVIIATGAKHRVLGIPGEREFSSRGVSYCATCDGPFFKEKDLIVVGGGDSALSEAAFLSKFARSIKIIHRKERFRAVNSLVEDASKINKISFIFNSVIKEIKGDNLVRSVIIKDTKTDEERRTG